MATSGVVKGDRAIFVSGISSNTTKESLEMFFESPKRTGGGDMESCHYDKDKGIAVIVFIKADDAHNVIQRAAQSEPLELNGTALTVQKYTMGENQRDRTVTISGFNSATTKDTIELYFESSKNSGGGDIEEWVYDEAQKKAQITFEHSTVAQRVLKNASLILDGDALTVKSGFMASQSASIKATGFLHVTSEDTIEMFFESEKKSGGGEIANIVIETRKNKMEVIIEYVDPIVAERVLAKTSLMLDGAEIRVYPLSNCKTPMKSAPPVDGGYDNSYGGAAFIPPKAALDIQRKKSKHKPLRHKSRIAHTPAEHVESECDVCAIEVRKIPEGMKENTIKMLFESKKKTGGEPFDSMHYDMKHNRAVITYRDAPAAKKVVSKFKENPKKFKLEKCQIQVELMHPAARSQDPPAPLEPLKCLLLHVPVDIASTEIRDFLRQASEIKNILYSHEYPVVMIEFHHQPDYDMIDKLCMTKPLRGKMVAIQRLALPKCVQVHNVDKADDEFEMYFESKDMSGGGESLQRVEDCSQEHYAILHFGELADVKGVLHRKHVLSGRTLIVSPFYPDFGVVPSFYKPTNSWLTPPEPITVDLVKPEYFDFLAKFCVQTLNDLGKKYLFQIDWTNFGRSSLHVCFEVECDPNDSGMIQQKANPYLCQTVITDLVDGIESQSISMMQSVYSEAVQRIQHECQKTCLVQANGLDTITITGFRNQVELLKAGKIKEQLEMDQKAKDATITDSVPMKRFELELFKMTDLESGFSTNVKVAEEPNGLKLTGARDEVTHTMQIIGHFKNSITTYLDITSPAYSALVRDNMDKIARLVKAGSIKAVIEQQGSELTMFGLDQNEINRLMRIVSTMVTEFTVPLQSDKMNAICTREWEQFKYQMETQYATKLRICEQQSELRVACSPDISTAIEREIKSKISLLSITSILVPAGENTIRLLQEFHHQQLRDEEDKWMPIRVKITPVNENNRIGFKVHAPGVEMHDVTKSLQLLLDKVVSSEHNIYKPMIAKQLLTDQGETFIKAQEVTNKVVCEIIGSQNDVFQMSKQQAPVIKQLHSSRIDSKGATAPTLSFPAGSYKEGPLRNSVITKEGITVQLCIGSITDQRVQVIVNSARKDLNLSVGAVSSAILNAAGQTLQTDCSKAKPNGLQAGELLVTSAGNISGAKAVYHVVLPRWSGNSSLKELSSLVMKILEAAKKSCYSSLAFPTLGSGYLAYPHKDIARIMFDDISTFSKTHPKTKLKDIRIAIYHKDAATIQAFESEVIGLTMRTSAPITDVVQGRNLSQSKPKYDGIAQQLSGNVGISIGKISLCVKHGDLTKETADAIVNSTGPDLQAVGAVCKAVMKDEAVKRECANLGSIKGVAITTGGNLNCKKVIHMDATKDDWENQVYAVLVLAKRNGIRSLAFPAFGTGKLAEVPSSDMTRYMYNAIQKFEASGPGSVTDVRIIAFEGSVQQDFISHFNGMTQQTAVEIMQPPQKKQNTNGASLTIKMHALSDDAIRRTKDNIDSYCKHLCTNFAFDSVADAEKIKNLKTEQVKRIRSLEQWLDVEIEIQQNVVNKIVVSGVTEMVMKCVAEINVILDDVHKAKFDQTKGAMLKKQVQWEYQTSQGFTAYPDNINMIIEDAFKQKKTTIGWEEQIDGASYRIDFDRMEERKIGDERNEVMVRRIDKLSDDKRLPSNWDHMKDEKSKCYIVPKQDKKGQPNPEYKKVEDHFKKTAKASIVQIERVQNIGLYKSYDTHKGTVKNRNPQNIENERHLFHATSSPQNMEYINASGFSRSYSGDGAGCWYGKGVYFARDASKSMDYAKTSDDKNIYYMYRCKVLVGEFTKGQKNQSAPPLKPNSMFPYDSLVDDPKNPQEFNIFHDSAAYPEYIIAFKK